MLGRALRKGVSWGQSDEVRRLFLNGGVSTAAGVTVSAPGALAASAVYASTSLIAQTIAALPIRFVERGDQQRIPQKPVEAAALWGTPNPFQTTTGLVESTVLSLLLWGNAYLYPQRARGGQVLMLWPLDPDRITRVEPLRDGDNVVGATFTVTEFQDVVNRVGQPAGMIHIPDVTLPGRIKGISRIEQMAELIGMSLSAQKHASQFLGQGVHLTGTIEVPTPMNKTMAQAIHDGFMEAHAGPGKAGGVGVLTGGATFKTLMLPPAELQFLEQVKWTDAKIAGLYRVPPHMIGDVDRSTSWGTGIEEQTIQFVQHTLLPIIRKIEEAFEATLLAGTNYQMRFVTAGLLRGSMTARKDFYQALWNMGALSADDIRALEELPPLPDGLGQIYYYPTNFAPAGTDPASLPSAAKLLLQMLAEGRAA